MLKKKNNYEEKQKEIEIIRRYYPNEYDELLKKNKNKWDTEMKEITSNSLKDYQKIWYYF